ncbi:FAD synthase-like [Octopus sinensis]|uniref:FAD synthase n=1 Tax=Octopus sinensis TaxID=2607531 RepID=A0A6P7U406_9MOLL|nr:FAD synthase-like [Octopus sinensis]
MSAWKRQLVKSTNLTSSAGSLSKIEILILHISTGPEFPELTNFIQESFTKDNRKIKAVFMGTRGDDFEYSIAPFMPCDEGWPPLIRVNPILSWNYREVWNFIERYNIDQCQLYEMGFT